MSCVTYHETEAFLVRRGPCRLADLWSCMTHWVMLENTHCLRDEITLEVLSYKCKFRGRPVSEELRRELANWEVFEAILPSGERDKFQEWRERCFGDDRVYRMMVSRARNDRCMPSNSVLLGKQCRGFFVTGHFAMVVCRSNFCCLLNPSRLARCSC